MAEPTGPSDTASCSESDTFLPTSEKSLPPDYKRYLIYNVLHPVYVFVTSLPPKFVRKGGLQPRKKLGPTSYLDALRGWAAFIVVNHHKFPYVDLQLFQYPFFTLLTAGRAMVDIFFVISGYVLGVRQVFGVNVSYRKDSAQFLDTSSSAIFRRYIRLYPSSILATSIALLVVRLGWQVYLAPQLPTFHEQLWHWILATLHFSNPFGPVKGYYAPDAITHEYLDVLWTIPVEFRGSLVLYLFCIATCKLRTRSRMALCWTIIILCYLWSAIWAALFLMGLSIADLNLARQQHEPQLEFSETQSRQSLASTEKPQPRPQPIRRRILMFLCLLLSLFLLGQPSSRTARQNSYFPWPYLDILIPETLMKSGGDNLAEHFWLSIGATLLVFSLDSYATLQTPLRWNLSQYLGEVSFGIYVMHPLVYFTFWARLMIWKEALLGTSRWTDLPAMLVYWAAVLWAAELFTRMDCRVVALGRWVQTRLFVW
ncbi:hypothetical protein FKW77_002174 [Venturia effusa]|uniref:Acyltransferase 3 domain-containing protein n=1 Tax=Venturia effusa TaxID=50376 RepID=A0A517LAG5_9PEZI|nr:hypothetical protein FKW77_002174 [Venturia effusa]